MNNRKSHILFLKSNLEELGLDGCMKLEVLPELPHSLYSLDASDCTSLREVSGSYEGPSRYKAFRNCPKLFKNVTIDSEGSISKTQCLDSSITSQGFVHQLSAFLGLLGFQTNRCEFFLQDIGSYSLDIGYHGNSIPEGFTNRSKGKHVKVELPSDWCYDKFRGYGACVVFKRKKPQKLKKYSRNGASLNQTPFVIRDYFEKEVIGIQDSYMIWWHYTWDTRGWKEAKNFVTVCFEENNEDICFEQNNEDIEVKEFGVRLICDEDLQQEDGTNLSSMFPTQSQHGGAISYMGPSGFIEWSC